MTVETLIKAWALRELEAMPRGAWSDWRRHGAPPPDIQQSIASLPEAVAALLIEHIADDLGDCELCRRRAPCRLVADGGLDDERDWRCAWGCPPPEADPATADTVRILDGVV